MVLWTQQSEELWRMLQGHVQTSVEFTGLLLLESCYKLLLINDYIFLLLLVAVLDAKIWKPDSLDLKLNP